MADIHSQQLRETERQIIGRAVTNRDAWPEIKLIRPCDFSTSPRYILWEAISFSFDVVGRYERPVAERYLRDRYPIDADELLQSLDAIRMDGFLVKNESEEADA